MTIKLDPFVSPVNFYRRNRVQFKGSWPKCTDPETYAKWRESARFFPPQFGFCEDCLPRYQALMVKKGLCEHPEIVFDVDEDGFESGRLP